MSGHHINFILRATMLLKQPVIKFINGKINTKAVQQTYLRSAWIPGAASPGFQKLADSPGFQKLADRDAINAGTQVCIHQRAASRADRLPICIRLISLSLILADMC